MKSAQSSRTHTAAGRHGEEMREQRRVFTDVSVCLGTVCDDSCARVLLTPQKQGCQQASQTPCHPNTQSPQLLTSCSYAYEDSYHPEAERQRLLSVFICRRGCLCVCYQNIRWTRIPILMKGKLSRLRVHLQPHASWNQDCPHCPGSLLKNLCITLWS